MAIKARRERVGETARQGKQDNETGPGRWQDRTSEMARQRVGEGKMARQQGQRDGVRRWQ